MSIVGFHRVLIGCATLFCLLFGGWSGLAWRRSGATSDLVLAALFVLASVGLAWYLSRLDRFLDRPRGS